MVQGQFKWNNKRVQFQLQVYQTRDKFGVPKLRKEMALFAISLISLDQWHVKLSYISA